MANPNWKKGGTSPNPSGRPSEARAELKKALDAAAKKINTTFLQHVADKALADTGVLKAVINKFLPDLKSIDAKVSGGDGKPIMIVVFDKMKSVASGKPKTKKKAKKKK